MRVHWSWSATVQVCAGAAIVLGVALAPAGAWAAQRVVIAEEFTATWCQYCPAVGLALAGIMDDPNSAGRFVMMQIHGDDIYATPWGNQRMSLYGITAYPTTVQDGILKRVGQWSAGTYRADFEARRNVPTPVTLRLGGVLVSGQTYRISATVGMEPGGTGRTVRLHMVQVLDYYPSGGAHNRMCFRQAASHQDIVLVPGQSRLVQRDLTFTGVDWTNRTNIRIIAWAQDASSPLEVHQVAVMRWPFMNDCNGNGIPDESDIAGGTSQDCNGNGIPDECDIAAFWDGNVAYRDCNGNGIPDGCEFANMADCDGNGYADACELAVNPSLDCNLNGTLDRCDVAAGTSLDCNRNNVPDECDIGQGASQDCNGNAIPDECDLDPNFESTSARLSPLGGVQQVYTLLSPPDAVGAVTLSFTAYGDLNFADENVQVEINGTYVDTIYRSGSYLDCDPNFSADWLTLSAATYNSLKAGGNVAIRMSPSPDVHPTQCGSQPTWIQVKVSYVGVPRSQDVNQNGIPDECEVPAGCKADSNCDRVVSWRDIDYFIAGMNNNEAAWRAKFLPGSPTCPYSNNDVNADGQVSWRDINPFVALMNRTCP